MPSTERSTFSIQELAIRFIFPMLIGGAVVYGAMQFMMSRGSDRPPIIVSDGSIKVEEVDSGGGSTPPGGKGKFTSGGTSGGRETWKHEHTENAPKRLHALVEGADTTVAGNCPVMYFVQDITTATFAYRYTGGDRTVIVSRDNKDEVVFDVDENADVKQTGGVHTLLIDQDSGADLVSVTFAWKTGNSTPVTCQFGASATPRVVFLQTTK